MIGLFRRALAAWVEAAVGLVAALVEGITRALVEGLTGGAAREEEPPEEEDDAPST